MSLLRELVLLREAEEEKKKGEVPVDPDTAAEDQAPTEGDEEVENKEEGTDEPDAADTPADDAEAGDDDAEDDTAEPSNKGVGEVAEEQGFEKSQKDMFAFGKTRKVTLLTKNEDCGGLELTLQYVINPATGAWSFRACLAGQSEEDMVEFTTGEDPSSLVKHLEKKKKITAHQAVENLNPPADKDLSK